MTESLLWHKIDRATRGLGKFVRVENPILPGTPDVAFTTRRRAGWIELKSHGGHLSPEQHIFLGEWAEAGGNAFVVWRLAADCVTMERCIGYERYIGLATWRDVDGPALIRQLESGRWR